MKVIHISDLHYHKRNTRAKSLVNKIVDFYQNYNEKPLVVLTGDLVDKPDYKDQMYPVKRFLEKLTENGFKILICHGNHDIKLMHGSVVKRNALSRFNYYFYPLTPVENCLNDEEEQNFFSYPLLHQFDHYYFVGLDSNDLISNGNARGGFSEDQLVESVEKIKKIKEQDHQAIIVSYFHHNPMKYSINLPLWFDYDDMKLINRARFFDLVSEHIDVMLFGHSHWNKDYTDQLDHIDVKLALCGAEGTHKNDLPFYEIDLTDFSYVVR